MSQKKYKTGRIFKLLKKITLGFAFSVFIFAGFLVLTFAKPETTKAAAGINPQINFQARLLTISGATVPDGDYNIRFKVYQDGNGCVSGGSSPCSGTLEWTEERKQTDRVTVINGYFSVMLGSVTAFGNDVDWNQDTLWLSVDIGGTADTPTPSYDGEMLPFKRLGANPYAFNSNALGGLTATQFIQLAQGVQADGSSSNASIAVNKTAGTAGLIDLQRGGTSVFSISNSGSTTFKTTTDSTTGFQIQDADGGVAVFNVDTDNERVGIGDNAPDFKLDVAGDIRIQGSSRLYFGGTGSGDNDVNLYRNGANELKTDDYLFAGGQIAAEHGGAAQTRIGAVGPSGQSGIVFGFDNSDPANLYRSAANTLKTDDYFVQQNASNSTTAFQIQNAGSDALFTADTTNSELTVTNLKPTDPSTVASNVLETVDGSGAGDYSSIALGGDGFARIAYYDISNQDLKFVLCNDDDCSSPTLTTVDSSGDVGAANSITMGGDGFARIAYYDATNTSLKFAQCTNASCSTSNITTVDNTANVGTSNSITMGGDGFARTAYFDETNSSLKFAQCTNAACSTSNITTVDTGVTAAPVLGVGQAKAISIDMASDDFARISYIGNSGADLKYAQCTNAACSTSNLGTVVSGGVTLLPFADSLQVGTDDFGRIAYADVNQSTLLINLKYVQCTNADCSTSNVTTVQSADIAQPVPIDASLAINGSNLGRISYVVYNISNNSSLTLKYVDCTNASCSTNNLANIQPLGTPSSSLPSFTSGIALGSDGFARLSYPYSNSSTISLKYARLVSSDGQRSISGVYIGTNSDEFATLNITAVDSQYLTLRPDNDEINIFQIQDSSGNALINVDSVTSTVQLTNTQIEGNLSASGTTASLNYSSSFQVTSDSFLIQSSSSDHMISTTTSAVNLCNSHGCDTVNIATFNDSSADTVNIGDTNDSLNFGGNSLFKKTSNSTTAFQVQNSAGGNLIQADTSNSNLTILGLNSGELQTWNTNSNALPAARSGAGSATANGYMYVTGGETGGTAQATVYYATINANGSVGSYSSTTALPAARAYHSTVTANGYLYVLGGQTGGTPQTTVYYAKLNADGTVGSWNTTTVLSTALSDHSSAVANGYVYVVGGYNSGGSTVNTTYYAKLNADGTVGSWSTTNTLPATRGDGAVSVANGYIYYFGGENSGVQSTVYYATLNGNGTTGSWSSTTALPEGRLGVASAIQNGYAYVVGGDNGSGATNSTYFAALSANGTVGSWSTNTTTLPAVRSDPTVTVQNGYIYTVGGHDGSNAASTVYYASGSRLSVAASLDLVGLSGENLAQGASGGSLTAGNASIVGNLNVQGQASFNQGADIKGPLNVAGTTHFSADSDQTSGVFTAHSFSGIQAADSTGNYHGIGAGFEYSGTGTLSALQGAVINASNSSSGTVTSLYGSNIGASISSSGPVTTAIGTVSQVTKNGTGAVTQAYGGYFGVNNSNASGTITNAFGIYIADSGETGTITNDFGLYQADTGAANYFAGSLAVDGAVVLNGISAATSDRNTLCIGNSTGTVTRDAAGNNCDTSSQRFKHDIQEVDLAGIDLIKQFQPKSFIYNKDEKDVVQYGFIAEDLEQLDPKLVVHDDEGLPFSIYKYGIMATLAESIKEIASVVDLSQAVGGENPAITIDEQGDVGIGGAAGEGYKLEVHGNTHIAGTLSADKIEGLDELKERIEQLEEAQQSDSNQSNNNDNQNQNSSPQGTLDLSAITVQTANISLALNSSGALNANGGIVVGSTATFNGDSIFNRLVSFIERVIFNNDVSFKGRATFNNDSGGFAVINPGQTEVEVPFTRPFSEIPIVTASVKNGIFVQYAYKDLTANSFKIVLSQPAATPVEFSWTALSVEAPRTVQTP